MNILLTTKISDCLYLDMGRCDAGARNLTPTYWVCGQCVYTYGILLLKNHCHKSACHTTRSPTFFNLKSSFNFFSGVQKFKGRHLNGKPCLSLLRKSTLDKQACAIAGNRVIRHSQHLLTQLLPLLRLSRRKEGGRDTLRKEICRRHGMVF